MISHHPDSNLLVEYANGSCDWALGILINTHLQHCRHCRSQVQQLEHLGSALLTCGPKVTVDDTCLDKLLRRIDEAPAVPMKEEPAFGEPSVLPPVVQRLMKTGARWQKISKNLKQQRLVTGQDKYEVALQSIKSGGQVSRHDHRGMEYTVVLQGSFSDAEGMYCMGDFVLRKPGQAHKPTASQNEDCLCLTAVEHPVRLTHWFARLLNPFLRIHPA